MRFAIDFDDTVVLQDHDYADMEAPLNLLPYAKEGLQALKRAGHKLLLWSARASPALIDDPSLDPWVKAGVRKLDARAWSKSLPLNLARYRQMIDFVERELPGIFDAIDDGRGGKPSVDRFIDDRAGVVEWRQIAEDYGEPEVVARRRVK